MIDQEVRKVIDRNYDRARKVLAKHMDQLHAMADALMKFETIDKNQIEDIMSGKKVRLPENWIDSSKKINGNKTGKLGAKSSQGSEKKPTTRTRRKKPMIQNLVMTSSS